MAIVSGEETARRMTGLVHLDTQKRPRGIDLTAAKVGRFTAPGSLDFGGSEFARAEVDWIEPARLNPDDDYGWWELSEGIYRLEYNEALEDAAGVVALVRPHRRLLTAGGHHATFQTEESGRLSVVLVVGKQGLRIKENARVSALILSTTD